MSTKKDVKVNPIPEIEDTPIFYTGKYSIADVINYTGEVQYKDSSGSEKTGCIGGKSIITAINPSGTHPYHIVFTDDSEGTVCGWVDEELLEGIKEENSWTPRINDTVIYNCSICFGSSDSSNPIDCISGEAKIAAIDKGKKHPYFLIRNPDKGSTVYGWVNKGSFIKKI